MYNFILQIALMVALGVMIYLVARAVPRISDEIAEPVRKSRFEKIIGALPLERLDSAFMNFLEKFLRRLRLALLKLDNFASRRLHKVRELNSSQKNGEEKPTLFNQNGNGNVFDKKEIEETGEIDRNSTETKETN